MKLITERLTLIPMDKSDIEIFHQSNTNSFIRKYLWDDQEIPLELSKEILEEVENRFSQDSWGLWKINKKDDNQFVGYVGLWIFFDENHPQLLYALLPEFTKKGYATEASRKIIEYAFQQLNFDYLIATMDKPNIKSINVCEKLNFSLVEEKEIERKAILFYRIDKNIF